MKLNNYAKKVRSIDDQERFKWMVFVDENKEVLEKIEYVEYLLHPTFPNPRRIRYDRESGFALTSSGWGQFTINAKIHLKDGKIETVQYDLNFRKKWPKDRVTLERKRPIYLYGPYLQRHARLTPSVKGVLAENIVIEEFLKRNLDVFRPVVDTGIDCVIRAETGQFYEVQIKARVTRKTGKYVFDVRNFKVKPNFFIVLYQMELHPKVYWIVPSEVFAKYCRPKGDVCRLVLNPKTQRALEYYRNNFDQFTL